MKTKVWDFERSEWSPDRHAVLGDGTLMFDCDGEGWVAPADPERFRLHYLLIPDDLNSKEVWEGDIVKYRSGLGESVMAVMSKDGPYFVRPEASLKLFGVGGVDYFLSLTNRRWELVGNIRTDLALVIEKTGMEQAQIESLIFAV